MSAPKLWTAEYPDGRTKRIDALAPDRSMHDVYQGKPLPDWSPEAKSAEFSSGRIFITLGLADRRADVTTQERIDALRGLFKGSEEWVKKAIAFERGKK